MLKEFLEQLSEVFTKREQVVPVVLPFKASKRLEYYWDPAKKEVQSIPIDRDYSRHQFLSIGSIVDYLKAHPDRKKSAIWIGRRSIVVEVEEYSNSDVLSMELVETPLFVLLQSFEGGKSIEQKAAIRLLRQSLSQADTGGAALVAIRGMKITSVGEHVADQSHDSSRIGKSLISEAAGVAKLPEFLTVEVDVFRQSIKEAFPVRLWLSIDFAKPGNIIFDSDSSAMQEAIDFELAGMADYFELALKEDRVEIYKGEYRVQE